jgi:hypothetical protein
LTPEALEAFASFWIPPKGKVAFGGIIKRLKQLAEAFKKAPRLWEQFKKVIGAESLADIPGAIKDLAKKGRDVLKGVVGKLFGTWPLKIYTLEKSKLLSFQTILDRLLKKHPKFTHWLDSKVKPKVNQFDIWLRENIPVVSRALLVAVYFFIWFNVIEFEWDFHSLTEALTGNMSLVDLLGSLPSSAVGALLSSLGLGMFSLLPAAFVARLAWLIAHRYVHWTGKGFEFDMERLSNDLGMSVQELEAEGI